MLPLLIGIAHQLTLPIAKQLGSVQVSLCGIVRRCYEIDIATLLVHPYQRNHVKVAFGYTFHPFSIGTYSVQMSPSVPLAHPCEELITS